MAASTMKAANIDGRSTWLLARRMTYPNPFEPAMNSPTTAPPTASEMEIFAPENIDGIA